MQDGRAWLSLMQYSAIGIAIVGRDGTWLHVNPATCRILGRTQDEILAATFQDVTHPDDLAADLQLVGEMLRRERDTYTLEKRYLAPDGTVTWVSLTVSGVYDQAGNLDYFVSQILDITALRESTAQLESLVRSIPAVVLLRDRNGFCTKILSLQGALFPRDAFLGTTLEAVAPPEAAALMLDTIRHVLDSRLSVSIEYPVNSPEDESRWFQATVSPVATLHDHVMVVARDVTEQKCLQSKLQELTLRDELTGLYNRRAFNLFLDQFRHERDGFTIFLLDLNDFKRVNDTFGHHAGDAVLKAVAKRLRGVVRSGDVIARLGGDEFCLLMRGRDLEAIAILQRRLENTIATPFCWSGRSLRVGVAVGTQTCLPGQDPEQCHQQADAAMYRRKQANKGAR